jgi:hypothetical protein
MKEEKERNNKKRKIRIVGEEIAGKEKKGRIGQEQNEGGRMKWRRKEGRSGVKVREEVK